MTVRVPILAYHSLDRHGTPISITPDRFRQQMQFLKERGYRTVGLKEALTRTGQGPRQFVLTFDDGYRNNFDVAADILRELDFRATVFVVTGHVGGKADWAGNKDLAQEPMMTWDQLKTLVADGFDVQPHSRTHPVLPEVSAEALEQEILGSREDLEQALGRACPLFCHPHGRFDARTEEVLARHGFVAAVSTRFGFNRAEDEPYRLRRIGSAYFRNHPGAFRHFVRGPWSCALAYRAGMALRRLRGRGRA